MHLLKGKSEGVVQSARNSITANDDSRTIDKKNGAIPSASSHIIDRFSKDWKWIF